MTKLNPKRALNLVYFLVFCDMVSSGLAYPSMPTLIQRLAGVDIQGAARLYGLQLTLFAAFELFGSPLLGSLSDRFGRKPVLVTSCLATAVFYLVSALAQSHLALLLGYAFVGLTSAMLVVSNAAVADTTPEENRAAAYGRLGAVFGLAFVLGPAVGGLVSNLGLRVPFFASAAVMLTAGLVALFFLPETLPKTDRKATPAWQDLLPWSSLKTISKFPIVRGLAVTILCNALALQMLIAVWIPYCTYRYGLDPAGNGYLLAAFGLAMAVGQGLIVPKLIPKLGEKRSLLIGLFLSVCVYIGYGASHHISGMVAVLVLGSLAALDEPAAQAIVTSQGDPDERGSIQGGLAMIGSLMGIVGPLAGAAVFTQSTGPLAPLEIPGLTFFAGALCVTIGLAFAARALRLYKPGSKPGSSPETIPANTP